MFETARKIWYIPQEYTKLFQNDHLDFEKDYNIMEDLNITSQKPRKLIILDQEYSTRSWKGLLHILCDQLYELEPQIFESLTKHRDFEGRDRRIISNDTTNMLGPYQVSENIFVETRYANANTILNYCKLIVEKYELQDDVHYNLKPR